MCFEYIPFQVSEMALLIMELAAKSNDLSCILELLLWKEKTPHVII